MNARDRTAAMSAGRTKLERQCLEDEMEAARAMEGAVVLLVDDDLDNIQMLQAVLPAYGFEVVATHDVFQAIKEARNAPGGIDLLLTELSLSPLTGAELFRVIRPLSPEMGVVYMTNEPVDAAATRFGLEEERRPIRKPFMIYKLLAILHRALPLRDQRS